MAKRLILRWTALGAALLLLAAGCARGGGQPTSQPGQAQPTQPKVLKIGAAVSLTGSLANEGQRMRKGYELWKNLVNQAGGVELGNGQKYQVEIVYQDDQSNTQTAAKLVEKLITEDKVDVLLGPYGSGITAAVSAISEKYRKIMIAPLANADTVYNRGFKYLFGVLGPISNGFGLHPELLASLNPRPASIAIVHADDLFPANAAAVAKKKAEELGLNVVYFNKFPKNPTDLSPIIREIKALNAEVTLIPGYFEDNVLFVKQAKELRYNYKYLGMEGPVTHPRFLEALGKDAEYATGVPWWVPNAPWKGNDVFGTAARYGEIYQQTYGEPATYYDAGAAAAGVILQHALRKVTSLDADALRQALLSLDIETFFGRVKYDETGFNRAKTAALVQIQDGQRVVVWPKDIAVKPLRYPAPPWDQR